MAKVALDDPSYSPSKDNEFQRSSVFTEDMVVSTDKDDTSEFKRTLYLPPLVNCSLQPVWLVAKSLDMDKGFVQSFVLTNPHSEKAYSFKVQRATAAVEVRPKRGIIKRGQKEVLHVILYPTRQTSSVNLIYILVSSPFRCTEPPTKNLREPEGIWKDSEPMFVLMHYFREEKVPRPLDYYSGEGSLPLVSLRSRLTYRWKKLVMVIVLVFAMMIVWYGVSPFGMQDDDEGNWWSFLTGWLWS